MTEEKFTAYEAVRQSGLTNMWDCSTVCTLAEKMTGTVITEDDVTSIIRDYDELKQKYLPKNEG